MLRLIFRKLIRLFGGHFLAESGPELFLKWVEKLNEYEYAPDDDGDMTLMRKDELPEEDNDTELFSENTIYALRQQYELKNYREQEYIRMKREKYIYEDDDAEMAELDLEIPDAPEDDEEEQVEMESI